MFSSDTFQFKAVSPIFILRELFFLFHTNVIHVVLMIPTDIERKFPNTRLLPGVMGGMMVDPVRRMKMPAIYFCLQNQPQN